MQNEGLLEKIRRLPPDKIAEVEDYVDFLSARSDSARREAVYQSIAAYASRNAGTENDLAEDLEASSLEFLSNEAIGA